MRPWMMPDWMFIDTDWAVSGGQLVYIRAVGDSRLTQVHFEQLTLFFNSKPILLEGNRVS